MQIHRGSQDKTQILPFMSWVLVSLASPVRRAECQLSADNHLEPQPNETKFPPLTGTRLGEEEGRLWEGGGKARGQRTGCTGAGAWKPEPGGVRGPGRQTKERHYS